MPPKQTTVYVGKISASVDDDVVRQLLEACGKVNDWKRMEDPDTKARKAFGFCEFEEADGVIRAMSLLQNLAIGGQVIIGYQMMCSVLKLWGSAVGLSARLC